VRKSIATLGLILVALGIVLYVILPIPKSHPTLVSGVTMTVRAGSSVPSAFHIPVDADVSGDITTVSGGNLDIDFYVFDKNNYDNWITNQANIRYVYIYRASSGAHFSFRTDKENDYYFVFNNPQLMFGSDRSITWSASYEYNPYIPYAVPLLLLLVIIGTAIVAGTYYADLRQKMHTQKKMEKLRACPNCNQQVSIEKTICPHCGFDISKSIRCHYCNTIYDRSRPKCPNCGAKNK
jgi:RNA polymerase subunit RPABC4/transcription elongation factor Spt4